MVEQTGQRGGQQIVQRRFFAYDSLGRLLRVKHPEQGSLTTDTDFPALTDSSSGVSNSQWSTGYVYDANGNATKRKDARNVVTTSLYDHLNRNIVTTYAGGGTSTPAVRHYYDSLNRLYQSREVKGGQNLWVQYFDYDRWGNRTINAGNSSGGVPTPQFTVDSATNRLGVPGGYSGSMSYDAAGNLTTDSYTSGGTRAYDAENRMTSAQDFYGQTSAYTYDGDGRRVSRSVAGGAAVWQIYGLGGELLVEYAAGASTTPPQKEYGYRGGELLVQATAPVSTGTGLTASYFDNMNFTNLKLVRTDSTVNFDWGGGTPHSTVGVDTFTTRWEGKVEPLYTQTYTFYTVTDDGVRLWVNGQLVIDKWQDQGPTEWSGQIALTAGQRYDIRMEFYENEGGATAKLLWPRRVRRRGPCRRASSIRRRPPTRRRTSAGWCRTNSGRRAWSSVRTGVWRR